MYLLTHVPQIIIYAVCILTSAVNEVRSNDEYNTTTLYPVNKTLNKKEVSEEIITIRDETVSKEPKELNEINNDKGTENQIETTTKKTNQGNADVIKINRSETTTWKVDATLSNPIIKDEENEAIEHNDKNKTDDSKVFKPSQQLGSYYDEDAFIIPTVRDIEPFTPVKSGFISSPNDFFKLDYKKPKEYLDKPYKENSFYKPIKPDYDSKPTVEVPMKVPAGSLYKHPGPFKDKPGSDGDGDDFGLVFHSDKEKEVKKYKSPWQGLLNLITALVPVGIIVSALTPNLIELHTVENTPYGNHFSRRSVGASLPRISERCKRRLLCEIHSERNYLRQANQRQKHCYKIPCDDPGAMNEVLSWLLAYHSSGKRP
ncbi:uncharacterized protein LOC119833078 [Zerene cesonia]|uniref:uncharacterized protein LOC119833078 n=1 Tax=Zerene cesonia TaxID=33412 RepID=UPI0018E55A57|nr:uncharacterized protein LOC119833078 [Zerene cesonia]